MKQFTYEEWLRHHEIEPVYDLCDCCSGKGTDNCNSCDSEIECHKCTGAGEIDVTKQEYEKTLIREKLLIGKHLTDRKG